MKFTKLINELMPLVGDGSDLPCAIWRNKGDWQLDYINLPPEKVDACILGIKAHDPCVVTFKGSDYVNREHTNTAVSDYVLSERIWAEYNSHVASVGHNENYHNLAMGFENCAAKYSATAKEYLASLDRPLAEMNKIYIPITEDKSLQGKMGDTLINRIEAQAINANKDWREKLPFNKKNKRIDNEAAKSEAVTVPITITANIIAGSDSKKSVSIAFPTTLDKIKAAVQTDNISDCKIASVHCKEIPNLVHYVGYPGNNTTIDELQYIAETISLRSANEIETFSAFLEVQYTDEEITVKQIMDALENIDAISLDKTMRTNEDIGETWLAAALENCQPSIDRLSSSNDLSDKNFMNYIQLLNENFDTDVYGKRLCEENDMYITSKGVVSVDWATFFHREDREVPDECRLSVQSKPSILKQVEENKTKIAANDQQGAKKQKKIENTID